MTHDMRHLSEEQLDLLLRVSDPARNDGSSDDGSNVAAISTSLAHLQSCDRCQGELANLRTTLTGLRLATTGWAAEQAPPALGSIVIEARRTQARRSFGQVSRLAWVGAAGTLALAAGLAVSVVHTRQVVTAPPVVADVRPNPDGVANTGPSDEALLNSVENDLADSVPPTLAPLSISTAP